VYEHIVTDLFDRPIDIPVGIGEWAAIGDQLDVSIEEVEGMSGSTAEVARNIARQSVQWATEDTPENGQRNLREFVFEGAPKRSSVVFRGLIELLTWMHRSGVPGDSGRRSLDGMSIVRIPGANTDPGRQNPPARSTYVGALPPRVLFVKRHFRSRTRREPRSESGAPGTIDVRDPFSR